MTKLICVKVDKVVTGVDSLRRKSAIPEAIESLVATGKLKRIPDSLYVLFSRDDEMIPRMLRFNEF